MGNALDEIVQAGEKNEAECPVTVTCTGQECGVEIDRERAYLCGGCGGYVCGHHLYMSRHGDLCGQCLRSAYDAAD